MLTKNLKNLLPSLLLNGAILIGMLLSTSLFSSCCCSQKSSFKEQLVEYLKKDLPTVSVVNEKYAAYFDFSGIYVAYQNPETSQTFNGLTQKVTANASQFDTYKLADSEITEMSNSFSPAEQFQQLHDKSQQGKLYAPIEKTLKKIIDEGRSSILVTDFEEYTPEGVIYKQAYASPYFKSWLRNGGDITFFITDYVEGSLPKHLYYVVFDSNQHKLLELVENALSDLPHNYERFTLATNSYKMYSSYPSALQGGTYHDSNGDDIVTASIEDGDDSSFFMLDSLRAESYCFGCPWEEIVRNASDQTVQNGAEVPFTHLFRNVFIDFSHSDSYTINKLDVAVYDVQEDFDKYWGYYVAKNNPPEIKKEAGETYLDFEGHEDGQAYYDEKGKILPEYDYEKGMGKIIQINDMLLFDEELFESSRIKDPVHTELGIYFNKAFKGSIPQVANPNDLLRIDVIISDATICNVEIIDKLFGWQGNDCLSAAIKDVLQDMKPEGKPLYSYFVRIL